MKTDFLVIGGGIAGLSYAIKISEKFPNRKIIVLAKEEFDNSNTQYAQGGIASVLLDDKDIEKHIQDTLIAGNFQNDRKVVEMVVREGYNSIKNLIKWGVEFDKDKNGNFQKCLEGGHSTSRILHHKDITGREIQKKLIRKTKSQSNIKMLNYHFAIDLFTENNICKGVFTFDKKQKKLFYIHSKVTVMASGGIGQVYKTTTNPIIATGDGIAMCSRANVQIENIDLVQFHPTALYQKNQARTFLISEALRGAGAILKNTKGEDFMQKYDHRKELAPRDIVVRSIFREMKKNGSEYVFLDVTHLKLENKFPNIVAHCKKMGLNLKKNFIPVMPVSHYLCGGIKTNLKGETSIQNLYACGECASTGLHGTNRLASNSLLEAVVFANQIYNDSIQKINTISQTENTPIINFEIQENFEVDKIIFDLKSKLKILMNRELFVEKSNNGLILSWKELQQIQNEFEKINQNTIDSLEFKNLLEIAQLMIQKSISRKENTGVFHNVDF